MYCGVMEFVSQKSESVLEGTSVNESLVFGSWFRQNSHDVR